MVFSAGYAVNALYTALMFRWGAITASLTVAGGLLLGGIALVLAGHFMSSRPERPLYERLKASPGMSKTGKRLAGLDGRRDIANASAGALAGAMAIFTLAKLRGSSEIRVQNAELARSAAKPRHPRRK